MKYFIFFVLLGTYTSFSRDIWNLDSELPGNKKCFFKKNHKICFSDKDRKNVFNLNKDQLNESLKNGSEHALFYPVTISDLQAPYDSLQSFFQTDKNSPIKRFVYKIIQNATNFTDIDKLYKWIGLNKYPKTQKNTNLIYNTHKFDNERMGATISKSKNNANQLTFGCAACHSADLFGTKVLGMTNRFPRANEFFIHGKRLLSLSNLAIYKALLNPSKEDIEIYNKAKYAIRFIDLKKPKAIGLDTSLAQVALSLSKRAEDKYASRKILNATFARKSKLKKIPADSKPAVWWNVKYKTKFLSDGSLRSGNPIHTNFLWNEIGRGTDLKKLEKWLTDNQKTIDDLTSYVFNTKAPQYNDFFPNEINIKKAKKGEILFQKNCMSCHGEYEKGWSNPKFVHYKDKIRTIKTWYHTKTVTIDVKTDPLRYEGMNYFYKDLNRLKISKSIGTVVRPQKGYVPPPLEGIWARWPYFHNNSVPTLYDVLTIADKRPKSYYSRAAINKETDFDKIKNGYPALKNNRKYFFNTKVKGLSNQGHSFMLTDKSGKEKFSHKNKLQLIEFLKTL